MKTVKVVAAIIIHENKIFATQRGYGEFKDGWEFPGGKIEPGETPQEALVREIKEELDIEIEGWSMIIQSSICPWTASFVPSSQVSWCSKSMRRRSG